MKKAHFGLLGVTVICLMSGVVSVEAQPVLQLVIPSASPILPGSTFELDAVISGLAPSALDGFDFTLATLPAGITLTNASSPLANWMTGLSSNFPAGSPQIDGIADDPSDDVTGTATLAEFDFSVANNASAQGTYTINFIPQTPNKQDLFDSSGNQITPFTQTGATVDVVPEPRTTFLLLAGLMGFGLFFSTKRMSPAFLRP